MPLFGDFSDDAYLRAFATDRRLEGDELVRLERSMREFLRAWESHEQPVKGDFTVLDGRFLLVAADLQGGRLSGCSKDGLVGQVRRLEVELGVDLVATPPVWFRRGAEVATVTREAFRDLVKESQVTGDTVVYDNTVHTVGAVRGRFELPARDSWHGQSWGLSSDCVS